MSILSSYKKPFQVQREKKMKNKLKNADSVGQINQLNWPYCWGLQLMKIEDHFKVKPKKQLSINKAQSCTYPGVECKDLNIDK